MPLTPGSLQNRWLLGAALAVPLALLVGLSILSDQAVRKLERTTAAVSALQELKRQSTLLLGATVDNETGQRGFILSQNPVFLEPYDRSLAAIQSLRKTIAASNMGAEAREHFARLEKAIDARLAFSAKTVELQRARNHAGSESLVKTGEGKRLMDQVRAEAAAFELSLTDLAKRYESEYSADVRWNERVSWSLVALDCLCLGLLTILLLRLRRTEQVVNICAWSKTIEYEGEWMTFEEYLSRKFQFSISHGINPEEARKFFAQVK